MAKTYLPQVERRIIVRPNQVFGIINYDVDNAYPQRVLEFVRQSPTAKACWSKRVKYLGGNGFAVPDLGKIVVNQTSRLTLAKLLKAMATDKGIFPGFGIHVNWNANFKISSVSFVKYEDIRQGNTQGDTYRGKYVIYQDWGRKTWRSIYMSKFDIIDPFNPDPEVIKAQVIAAGGWDKYKGQLFYLTPVVDDYDLCEFDAALEDIQTEAGIKIFNNRQVETGFLPSGMLFTKARREFADEQGAAGFEGSASELEQSAADLMAQNLATFQGAANAQKIINVEYEDIESKPEFVQYNIQNNDKLFEQTSKGVEGNIIKAFSVPKELITSDSKNGLSNGGEKREAINEMNDLTAPERMEISEVLQLIFRHFYININPDDNWAITEVTTEGMGVDVIKYADKVQAIIESPRMTRDNKINTLVNIYGFKSDQAESMIPADEFIKAAVSVPEPAKKPNNEPLDNAA